MKRKRIKLNDETYIKVIWACLVAASIFGLIGLILPPLGVIDGSVLILCGQFLVLCAGCLLGSATVIKQLISLNKIINKINDNG